MLLALKRMKAGHTAEDISTILVSVILDFELGGRLGVSIADNPDVNDNAIRLTLKTVDPAENDTAARRARCLGQGRRGDQA